MPGRNNPYSWQSVRLPESDLAEAISDLAAPLLAKLGPTPQLDVERGVMALVISFWNASVLASKQWSRPRMKGLKDLKKRMRGREARREDAAVFDLLAERWRAHWLDPRLVEGWTYAEDAAGTRRLTCTVALPDGVRAEVLPPSEKRIAIGGPAFLDEVLIRLRPGQYLGFPYARHTAAVAEDGTVTVEAMMPTALQLFADGRLSRVGGAPIAVTIGGRALEPMNLVEVRCAGESNELARLVFKPVGK